MILPPNIKSDLGNKDNHLNIRIIIRASTNSLEDEDNYSSNDIFLSKSPVRIGGHDYAPLLIKSLKFKDSIDIKSRNFKTSKINISISNIKYRNKIFSNFISSRTLINKEVDIWLDTQSTVDNETSIMLARGYITRFTHDTLVCNIQVEDLTEKKLSKEIPSTIVTSSANEKYTNEPIPFVYGTLNFAPTVIDDGIVKADTDNIKLITSNAVGSPYQGIGTNAGYKSLGIFEGYGDDDAKYRSPLTIYVDDIPLPVLKNQALQAFGEGSNTQFGESQWDTFEDIDGPVTRGWVSLKSLETYEDNILQCQIILKPSLITGINRSHGDDFYWNQYLNDYTGDMSGWQGVDVFSQAFKDQLIDGIDSGDDMESFNCTIGGQFFWGGPTLVTNNNVYRNINLSRIAYTYDPPFSISRHGYYHYLAVNDKVIPRLFNSENPEGYHKLTNLFVFPKGVPSWDNFEQASFKIGKKIISLDTDLNSYELDQAYGDSFEYQFKDLFTFTHLLDDSDYTGYSEEEFPQSYYPITISDYSSEQIYNQPYVLFSGDDFGIGHIIFGSYGYFNSNSWLHDGYNYGPWANDGFPVNMDIGGYLNELSVYFIAEIAESTDKEFYLNVEGRSSIIDGSTDTSLKNALDIIRDIAIREMGLDESQIDNDVESPGYFGNARNNNDINMAFSVNKSISIKKLLEDIAKSTLCFPYFKTNGSISFPSIKEQYFYEDYDSDITSLIDNKDIIKYSFNLSNIEDVYTRVNIAYKYNYHNDDFSKRKESSFGVSHQHPDTPGPSVYTLDSAMYPYQFTFYGHDDVDANILNFESKYITEELEATKLQKKLFEYHRNQHLELDLSLPIKYVNLEVGSIIKFDELIDGVKAYGQDYTKVSNNQWYLSSSNLVHYGQFYYPLFMVTSINKNLKSINIKAVRLHCLNSGYVDLSSWQGANLLDTSQIYSYDDYGPEIYQIPEQEQDIIGCMDPLADNYDPDATIPDNDTCIYSTPAEEEEIEYVYPNFPQHLGIRLLEEYEIPAIIGEPATWHSYDYTNDMSYGDNINQHQHGPETARFIPIKDLYLQAPYNMVLNPDVTWYTGEDNDRFVREFIDSSDDSSLINFFTEFIHPQNNLHIGHILDISSIDEYDYSFNFSPSPFLYTSTEERYEMMFASQLAGSDGLPFDDWLMYQYWGWSNSVVSDLDNSFWRTFVAIEIKIKDYRIYGEMGGPDLLNQNLTSAIPETLPDWILEDWGGKITIALVCLNNEGTTSIDEVRLGWRIFPGHYDYKEYMDIYSDFYNDAGQWIYNDEIDIGWGYTFPGDDTWRNFSNAMQETFYTTAWLNILAGSHSSEDQWIKINLFPSHPGHSEGIYPELYTGIYDLVKTCQNSSNNITTNHIPQSFGLWSKNLEPFIVYREDYSHHFLGMPGDVNLDLTLNILDMVAIVNYILGSGDLPEGANPDFNQDGTTNILDIVAMANYILGG